MQNQNLGVVKIFASYWLVCTQWGGFNDPWATCFYFFVFLLMYQPQTFVYFLFRAACFVTYPLFCSKVKI